MLLEKTLRISKAMTRQSVSEGKQVHVLWGPWLEVLALYKKTVAGVVCVTARDGSHHSHADHTSDSRMMHLF